MNLIHAVGEALKHVIIWIKMVFDALRDWLTPSEGAVFGLSLILIGYLIKYAIKIKR